MENLKHFLTSLENYDIKKINKSYVLRYIKEDKDLYYLLRYHYNDINYNYNNILKVVEILFQNKYDPNYKYNNESYLDIITTGYYIKINDKLKLKSYEETFSIKFIKLLFEYGFNTTTSPLVLDILNKESRDKVKEEIKKELEKNMALSNIEKKISNEINPVKLDNKVTKLDVIKTEKTILNNVKKELQDTIKKDIKESITISKPKKNIIEKISTPIVIASSIIPKSSNLKEDDKITKSTIEEDNKKNKLEVNNKEVKEILTSTKFTSNLDKIVKEEVKKEQEEIKKQEVPKKVGTELKVVKQEEVVEKKEVKKEELKENKPVIKEELKEKKLEEPKKEKEEEKKEIHTKEDVWLKLKEKIKNTTVLNELISYLDYIEDSDIEKEEYIKQNIKMIVEQYYIDVMTHYISLENINKIESILKDTKKLEIKYAFKKEFERISEEYKHKLTILKARARHANSIDSINNTLDDIIDFHDEDALKEEKDMLEEKKQTYERQINRIKSIRKEIENNMKLLNLFHLNLFHNQD